MEEEAIPKGNKALALRMTGEDIYLPRLCFSSFLLPELWKVLDRREEMAFNNWDLCVSPVLRYEFLWAEKGADKRISELDSCRGQVCERGNDRDWSVL